MMNAIVKYRMVTSTGHQCRPRSIDNYKTVGSVPIFRFTYDAGEHRIVWLDCYNQGCLFREENALDLASMSHL